MKYALLSIHIEPDAALPAAGEYGKPEECRGFEKAVQQVNNWKTIYGDALRIQWMIRVDPFVREVYGDQDWPLRRYAAQLEKLLHSGDSLGLHVHTFRFDEARHSWHLDLDDQDWVEHCIASSAEAFEAHFSRRATSIAMGNNFLNQSTVQFIRESGFHYDLSPIAGGSVNAQNKVLRATGQVPDFLRMPQRPYKPHAADFLQEGAEGNFWILPVTAIRQQYMQPLHQKLLHPLPPEQYSKFQLRKGPRGLGKYLKTCQKEDRTPWCYFECRTQLFNQQAATLRAESFIQKLIGRGYRFGTADDVIWQLQKETV